MRRRAHTNDVRDLGCHLYEKTSETSRGCDEDESIGGDDSPLNASLPSEFPESSLSMAENG